MINLAVYNSDLTMMIRQTATKRPLTDRIRLGVQVAWKQEWNRVLNQSITVRLQKPATISCNTQGNILQ